MTLWLCEKCNYFCLMCIGCLTYYFKPYIPWLGIAQVQILALFSFFFFAAGPKPLIPHYWHMSKVTLSQRLKGKSNNAAMLVTVCIKYGEKKIKS